MQRAITASLTGVALIAAGAVASSVAAVGGQDTRGLRPAARGLGEVATAQPAGDVNGDGLADLIVGLDEDPAERSGCDGQSELAHLVLGRRGRTSFSLTAPGDGVLRLRCPAGAVLAGDGTVTDGTSYGTSVGGAVAGVGDVNGDGLADVAVGDVAAAPDGRPNAGSVSIVFGARDLGDRDLRMLGAGGVRIDGPERASDLGRELTPVGDVDGDGHADLAMAYHVGIAADDGRRLRHDEVRVAIVHGGLPGGTVVDLRSPGDAALVLTGFARGASGRDAVVAPIAGAGDLDGDGRGELLVAQDPAHSVVAAIAGRPAGGVIDIRNQAPVLRVAGARGESLGASFARVGDLDGDGHDELAIGSALGYGSFSIPPSTGAVTVVPGRAGRIDLAHPRAGVLRILGPEQAGDDFGRALTATADVTGDGLPDLLTGAPNASPGCRADAGAAWLLPGRRAGGTVRVNRLAGAARIDGAAPEAGLGTRVAAGDLNADGRAELLLPALPDANAGRADLYAIDPTRPSRPAPTLRTDRCLRVRARTRSLRALRHTGRVALRISSDLGSGQRHVVAVTVRVVPAPHRRPASRARRDALLRRLYTGPSAKRIVTFAGPGTRTASIRMPSRLLAAGTRGHGAYLVIEAMQRLDPRDPVSAGFERTDIVHLGAAPSLR